MAANFAPPSLPHIGIHRQCDRSIGLKRLLHRREDTIAAVKCDRSIGEGAIVAPEVRSRFLPNEAIVCVSNYRSYELSCVGSDRRN